MIRDITDIPALPGGLPFDASQVQFTPAGAGAVARSVQSKERDVLSLPDFGSVGGGTIDDTAVFVKALAAANVVWLNGSDQYQEVAVLIPDALYKAGGGTGIVIPNGVVIVGQGRPRVTAASTGIIFTDNTANTSIAPGLGGGIVNLQLHGLGAGTALVGLTLNFVQNFRCENVRFDNLADQAVKLINGNTNKFRDVISFNCVINTTRGARTGQFEVGGSDHEFTNCEAFNSVATRAALSSASKFCVGWLVTSNNAQYIGCKGSVTDQAWYLDSTGSNNHYRKCRADYIYAEGVVNDSSFNTLDLDIYDAGKQTDNTYDGYSATVNSQSNAFIGGLIMNPGSSANRMRYGIADAGNTATRENYYSSAIQIINARTAPINNSGKVSIFDWGNSPPNTQTGATYTVVPTDTSIIANRAGTVTLTLENAALVAGKELTVRTIQAQTVVSATANVVPLIGGAAGTAILAATAGKWALLKSDGTAWQIMAGN